MPKVSIITLTYNGLTVLKPCVESVLSKCKDADFEWIIRENDSKDKSLEYLLSLDTDKRIKILKWHNTGNFSQMNNECLKECDGEYLLFLNNDVEAQTDFITNMAAILDKDPTVGGVGAVLYWPNKEIQHCGIIFRENKAAWNLNKVCMPASVVNSLVAKDRIYQAATGACFMMRKSEFIDLGKFDEAYDWCYDDVDLSLAITYKLKKKIVVSAKSILTHHESYSKAKPGHSTALLRLMQKWSTFIEPDYFYYNDIDHNIYEQF